MICGSVLRWPAAATRWQGWGRCWRPDPKGLRDEVGVLAHAVARALDLHHDGVVQQSVQQGGGDHRVRENLAPFGKAAIGRQDHGALLIARVHPATKLSPRILARSSACGSRWGTIR